MFKSSKVIRIAVCMITVISTQVFAGSVDASLLLKQRLTQLHTFEAQFNQRVTDAQNTVLQEATGRIALQYPNKLYWQLYAPNESELIADGQTLWQIDPFMEQVVAVNQNAAIDNNPLILLTNPNGAAWDDFNVSEDNNEFSITPKQDQANVVELILTFNEAALVAMKIVDGQQQISALTFNDIKQNKKLNESLFIFKNNSNFELDDQRTQ
ncbi:outer membrane lipoprotein chaperone LolA [Paraglaciecola sp.]|uniref:outer membrane lipoprotein chaperone LolA n=1 Tax=Paraglaciecola sp. TaxID=1920173 RepID=UPI00273D6572|nr:outer membrane lipoprotein chaperone LolA [Paraglaciecola sp.]MDP5031056.1 outer membrane lipoprotein chaperone LolA [Paraglaciecola sp.]